MFDSYRAHSDHEWRNSKRAILAYHVGGWREGESPLDALARALGISAQDTLLELTEPAIERDELEQLSICLGTDWVETDLNISDSIDLVILLVNEKLEDVPPELRAFFGAPNKIGPLRTPRSILNERCVIIAPNA